MEIKLHYSEYRRARMGGDSNFSLPNLPIGNCIKHGYVKRGADWPWSSFSRFVQQGICDMEWIGGNEGRKGMLIHTISEVKSPVRGTAFSRDGKLLIIADYEGVQIWNVNTWTLNRQLTESGFNLEVSPDGKYLAFMNNNISIYDLGQEKDKAIATINGKTDISSYTFRPDSLVIAYATNDGILSFYDLSSFSIIKSWQLKDCGKDSFPSIVYNSDGTLLTAVCQGNWRPGT